jgi:hypothetical protein
MLLLYYKGQGTLADNRYLGANLFCGV